VKRYLSRRLHQTPRSSTYLETTVLTALFLAAGWWYTPHDPLMLKESSLTVTVFLSIVTLFFGTVNGLLALALFLAAQSLVHAPLPVNLFLLWTGLVLLYGEFHYYWHHKLRTLALHRDAYEKKLDRMGQAFYALKVSHDQLELNYIIKPFSLRRTLQEIATRLDDPRHTPYDYFRILLEKTFAIHSLCILVADKGTFRCASATEAEENPDLNDPLVVETLQRKTPLYISQLNEQKSRYLAVLPALIDDRILGMVLIEKMPFMSFNEDNLTSVAFLFDYFMLSSHRRTLLKDHPLLRLFGEEFRGQLLEQVQLCRRYQVDSTLILFFTDSELRAHRLIETIETTARHFDFYDTVRLGSFHVTALLSSFSGRESARGLRRRLMQQLPERDREQIKSALFSLEEIDLVEPYIREETGQ